MKPILLALLAASSRDAQTPIASGAEPKLLADGYKFTEPVAWQREMRDDRPLPGRD